ncbi:hypothetical protein BH09VER1_BH09VER1_24650 [soil metagenome]
MIIPSHYDKAVSPWDLERCMESSGNAFVDARRTDAIEYAFRNKGNLLEDLQKARHCLDAAITELSGKSSPIGVSSVEKGWAVVITRDDGTEFFASAGPGDQSAIWANCNRRFAVRHKKQLRAEGYNARVAPVVYSRPQLLNP